MRLRRQFREHHTAKDPLGAWADEANLGNGYSFVGNSSLTYTDPYGLLTRGRAEDQQEARKARRDAKAERKEFEKYLRKLLGQKGYREYKAAQREFQRELRRLTVQYMNLLATSGQWNPEWNLTNERLAEHYQNAVVNAYIGIMGAAFASSNHLDVQIETFADPGSGMIALATSVAPGGGNGAWSTIRSAGAILVDAAVSMFVPGKGEYDDAVILFDGSESIGMRALAGVSLLGSIVTGGTGPNAGTIIKAAREGGAVGGKITGYLKHGLHQAIGRDGGRGVHPAAILDAVRSPTRVLEQAGGRMKYVGKNATVILDGEGKVVTTWGRPRNPVPK